MSELPEQLEKSISKTVWQLTKLVCRVVFMTSIIYCVWIAAVRTKGLVSVKVTALSASAEPHDYDIPILKQNNALPDYEIIVTLVSGLTINLGAKSNESAINGLTWTLNDPVSTPEIVSVKLQEQGLFDSETLTEVQITNKVTKSGNYRFEFTTERSASLGVEAFLMPPIGPAILIVALFFYWPDIFLSFLAWIMGGFAES